MLPVMDSLEGAIATPSASVETVLEGVHATRRQLSSALERNRVVEINPGQGAKFDPHQHQAISVVPAPTQDANTVVAVLQKGFLIADRVLRPALVTVSAPK
jgi:molecular chaperone GrpE